MDPRIYIYLATVFFCGGFAFAFWFLRTGRHGPNLGMLAVMAAGVVCQSLFLGARGKELGQCPVTNMFELLVFVAWAMVLLYFTIGTAYRWSLLGMFTAPMVFVFHVAALLLPDAHPEKPVSAGFWNELHKSLALLSFGAFALASIAGVMFLVQDHHLKRRRLDALSLRLPPLHNLIKVIRRLIFCGFAMLSAAIFCAYRIPDRNLAHSLLPVWGVWAVYAGIVIYALTRGMSGRKAALAAVLGFLLPLLTMWIVSR